MENTMKIYTISELERMSKTEIQELIIERGKLLFNLISEVLENKKLQVPKTNKIHEQEKNTLLKICHLSLKNQVEHLDINKSVLLFLEVDVELSKKFSTDSGYKSEIITSHMNNILEKVIDKKATILWTVDKVKNKDKLEMRLLFPDNLILPDLVWFQQYKELSKKAKKADKENYKKQFEHKLQLEIEEIGNNRFNIIKNNPAYFPEDRQELVNFIKKANKEFDKEAVKNIIKKYSDDEEIVVACIGLFNNSLFKYASKRLQNDREFVLKMVDLNVNILEHAPERYLDDNELMDKAIEISGYIIRTASDRLRNDKQFCLKAIKSQASAYSVIPKNMQEDNDLLMEAMNQRGEFLMYSPLVKTDKQLLIKAFSNAFPLQSRHLVYLTSDEFKNDPEVALAAIKCSPDNIWEISQSLREQIGDTNPVQYLTQKVAEIHNLNNNVVTNSDTNSVKSRKKKF